MGDLNRHYQNLEFLPILKNTNWVILFLNISGNGQPLDQHLSAALSAPISCLISTCQSIDQHLRVASLTPVSQLISTCQQLDKRVSASWSALNQPRDDHLLSRPISFCQPLEKYLSARWSAPVTQLISTCQQIDQGLPATWLAPVSCLAQPGALGPWFPPPSA